MFAVLSQIIFDREGDELSANTKIVERICEPIQIIKLCIYTLRLWGVIPDSIETTDPVHELCHVREYRAHVPLSIDHETS